MARTPVIIDTDPGVDDILAILLALASPELDVRAIIITFGNTDVEAAHLNVFRLHKALSKQFEADPESRARYVNLSSDRKIILAKGADFPLEGELHSAQYFHGRDGLGEASLRHSDLNIDSQDPADYPWLDISDKPGVDVALDVINSEPSRSITYIALGPLTSLAHLMRKHGAAVRDRLGQIICMGGALDVPGNTSAVAEFNFFADPFAVKELLDPSTLIFPHSRWLLIPLDITTPHELPFPLYEQRIDRAFGSTSQPSEAQGKVPIVHFTSAFLERTREVMKMFGKDAMELHDIVAVWCACDNPPVGDDEMKQTGGAVRALHQGWAAVPRRFQVERLGELTRGMLVVDRREDEGAYDPGANRAAVQAELEKHHFHTSGVLESTAVPALTEVEEAPSKKPLPSGVPVVVKTPGSAALLQLLCSRVWGVPLA